MDSLRVIGDSDASLLELPTRARQSLVKRTRDGMFHAAVASQTIVSATHTLNDLKTQYDANRRSGSRPGTSASQSGIAPVLSGVAAPDPEDDGRPMRVERKKAVMDSGSSSQALIPLEHATFDSTMKLSSGQTTGAVLERYSPSSVDSQRLRMPTLSVCEVPELDEATGRLKGETRCLETKRSLAEDRRRGIEWLSYWGELQKLRESNKSLVDELQYELHDLHRIADEREHFRERFEQALQDVTDLSTTLAAEREHNEKVLSTEKGKYEAMLSENERLMAKAHEMRRQVTLAEDAMNKLRQDTDIALRAASKSKAELEQQRMQHAIEVVKLKHEANSRVRLADEKEVRLMYLEDESQRQADHIRTLSKTVEMLTLENKSLQERVQALTSELPRTHTRNIAGVDATSLQQLTQKSFQKRESELLNQLVKLRHENDEKKFMITSLKRFLETRFTLYEGNLLNMNDIDAATGIAFQMPRRVGPGTAPGQNASTRNNGQRGTNAANKARVPRRYTCTPFTYPELLGERRDEDTFGAAVSVSHFALQMEAYREIVWRQLPSLFKAMQSASEAMWETVSARIPADTNGSPSGEQETLHALCQDHYLQAATVAKAIAKAHFTAMQDWLQRERRLVEDCERRVVEIQRSESRRVDIFETKFREKDLRLMTVEHELSVSRDAHDAIIQCVHVISEKIADECRVMSAFALGEQPAEVSDPPTPVEIDNLPDIEECKRVASMLGSALARVMGITSAIGAAKSHTGDSEDVRQGSAKTPSVPALPKPQEPQQLTLAIPQLPSSSSMPERGEEPSERLGAPSLSEPPAEASRVVGERMREEIQHQVQAQYAQEIALLRQQLQANHDEIQKLQSNRVSSSQSDTAVSNSGPAPEQREGRQEKASTEHLRGVVEAEIRGTSPVTTIEEKHQRNAAPTSTCKRAQNQRQDQQQNSISESIMVRCDDATPADASDTENITNPMSVESPAAAVSLPVYSADEQTTLMQNDACECAVSTTAIAAATVASSEVGEHQASQSVAPEMERNAEVSDPVNVIGNGRAGHPCFSSPPLTPPIVVPPGSKKKLLVSESCQGSRMQELRSPNAKGGIVDATSADAHENRYEGVGGGRAPHLLEQEAASSLDEASSRGFQPARATTGALSEVSRPSTHTSLTEGGQPWSSGARRADAGNAGSPSEGSLVTSSEPAHMPAIPSGTVDNGQPAGRGHPLPVPRASKTRAASASPAVGGHRLGHDRMNERTELQPIVGVSTRGVHSASLWASSTTPLRGLMHRRAHGSRLPLGQNQGDRSSKVGSSERRITGSSALWRTDELSTTNASSHQLGFGQARTQLHVTHLTLSTTGAGQEQPASRPGDSQASPTRRTSSAAHDRRLQRSGITDEACRAVSTVLIGQRLGGTTPSLPCQGPSIARSRPASSGLVGIAVQPHGYFDTSSQSRVALGLRSQR